MELKICIRNRLMDKYRKKSCISLDFFLSIPWNVPFSDAYAFGNVLFLDRKVIYCTSMVSTESREIDKMWSVRSYITVFECNGAQYENIPYAGIDKTFNL